jgi:hypothetical protein
MSRKLLPLPIFFRLRRRSAAEIFRLPGFLRQKTGWLILSLEY